MKCPKCSTEIPDGSPFCTSCGAATGDMSAATVSISLLELEDPLLKAIREELAVEYYVEKELGRGGMAIVYKGKENGLERQVALKILPPEMAMAGGTAERFKREARLAAAMDHPNIIPIYRVGQAGNFHYMAMKYVEGRAVDSMVHNQGALPIHVATRILRDAASALAFAHDAGIIHRDVKGGNILVDKNDGRVMMSDFGIARAAGEASLTASGMMVGTPSFMSPEQCGAGAVGPQSDQYSLGILGFQLLTGQLPFEAESLVEIIQHHYMTPPPDMREVRKEVPDQLYNVIYKALEKNPNDRFGTTTEMAEALEEVPLSTEEKKEAVLILKELASGTKVGEVRTASLPPAKLRTGPLTKLGAGTGFNKQQQQQRSRSGLVMGVAGGISILGIIGYLVLTSNARGNAADSSTDPAALAASRPAFLAVKGLPPGAKLLVDGKETQPNTSIAPGPHTYVLSAPGHRADSGAFNVAPSEIYNLASRLTPVGGTPVVRGGGDRPTGGGGTPPPGPVGFARFSVGTDPTSAEILVDGTRMGAGRVIDSVAAGFHRVKIQLAGCQTFDTAFTARAGEPVNLGRISLKSCGGG